MNNSKKKWLVLLVAAVVTLAAVTLASCNLFGPNDRPERLEIVSYSGGLLPKDVTQFNITEYIGVQYYDKTGNGNMLTPSQYTVTSFNKTETNVYVAVAYNSLTADAQFGFADDGGDKNEMIDVMFKDGDSVVRNQTVRRGESIPNPGYSSDEYRDFLGWYTANGDLWNFSQPLTVDGDSFVLTAKWQRMVTVNFFNGDDLFFTRQIDALDEHAVIELPEDEPTKQNYAFAEWRTEYDNPWLPENGLVDEQNRVMNLHACFVAVFRVAFDTNGGEPIEPITVKNNEPILLTQTAQKSGCEFLCWSFNYPDDSRDYRRVFTDGYALSERPDDLPPQEHGGFVEAGYTLTVYAEWLDRNVETQGLTYRDYVNAQGVTETDKCVVTWTLHQEGDPVPIEGTAFSAVIPSVHDGKTVVGVESAFANNDNLIAVVLPDTVTEIGDGAFVNCINLRDINAPDNLRIIGEGAFSNCAKIQIRLNEGLTSIGKDAFRDSGFNGELPSTLTSIGHSAFYNCQRLVSVTLNPSLCRESALGNGVFAKCSNLAEVTLPDNAEIIPNQTFMNCASLSSIVLPSSLQSIGIEAFRGAGLTSVTIPNASISYGKDVFRDCASLSSAVLPNGLESIPEGLFYNCSALKSITFPSTVKHIASNAFRNAGLTTLTMPEGLLDMGDHAFTGNAFTEVAIPAGLTVISDYAFSYCSRLSIVRLHNNIVTVGKYAFADTRLRSVGVNPVADSLSIILPDSVEKVDDHAFSSFGANYIELLDLGSVKYVGEWCFPAVGIKNFTMSDSIEHIGANAFKYSGIYSADNLGALFLDNVRYIGTDAFYGRRLTGVNISSNTELELCDGAFRNVSSLANVVLNCKITSIGANTFYGCLNLTNITVKDIAEIKRNAFAGSAIATFNFGGSVEDWLKVKLNDTVLSDSGAVIRFNGAELTGDVTLDIGGELVLGDYALQGLSKVTGFTLNNVKSIGNAAFYGCSELTSVVINSLANGEVVVSRNSFDGCSKLQFNQYGNGLYVGNSANEQLIFVKPTDESINTLELASDTKVVSANALRGGNYANLGTIILNDGLQYVGENAFCGCNNVTELTVPDSVIRIGKGAFEGWSSLERLTVPFVGESRYSATDNNRFNWIFGGQGNVPSSLRYVKISGDLATDNAFADCSNLTELDLGQTGRALRGMLYGCDSLQKLTLPSGSYYDYPTSDTPYQNLCVRACFHSVDYNSGAVPDTLKELKIAGGVLSTDMMWRSSITKLTLGRNVDEIKRGAFANCDTLTEIRFEGTVAEWTEVQKDEEWAYGLSALVTAIHCSNGDAALS